MSRLNVPKKFFKKLDECTLKVLKWVKDQGKQPTGQEGHALYTIRRSNHAAIR